MYILGIESSCDETAAAVVENGETVLSSVVASQMDTHGKYGGVVPELASREHLRAIVPVVRESLERAAVSLSGLDAIAATSGPGLVGSLLVGLTYAKSLAFARGLPLIAVNHIEGHILSLIHIFTAAVTFWTAGFDVIYACQDYEFDCAEALASVPRLLGISGALWVSRFLHLLMIVCLLALVHSLSLGFLALAGVGAVAALLIYEHSLVHAHDLSRVDAAFFTMNGWVSVLFFIFWAADIFLRHSGV